MADKLSESAKKIGQVKKNSEAALRRYNVVHPRIERVRDVFDDTIPFEMEFNTEKQDSTFNLDLYFNKPPPLVGSCNGRYDFPCNEYVLGPGNHLIQVTARYKPGTVVVFRNGVMLDFSQFGEYDPINGLVYVIGLDTTAVFNICYIVDSFVPCDPTFIATEFGAEHSFEIGANPPVGEITTGSQASVHVTSRSGPGVGGAGIWELFPNDDGILFPGQDNFRVSWYLSLTYSNIIEGSGNLSVWVYPYFRVLLWKKARLFFPEENKEGTYVENFNGAPGWTQISSSLNLKVTMDFNTARGTAQLLLNDALMYEIPDDGFFNAFSLIAVLDIDATYDNTHEWTGTLYGFELGCSLESPSG